MTRRFGDRQFIRLMLLFMLLTSLFAASLSSQSNTTSPNPAGLTPDESQEGPKTKQPVPGGTETSTAASPEKLRQAEIEAETKRLFELAAELRAEVAKTYKDKLSLIVIKKAEELEKLAKSLRDLMNKDIAAAKH